MIPSPHLRKNTFLLHLTIESPEETIEALSIRKPYICHMIPPFLWSIYLTYVSYLRPMCQEPSPFDKLRAALRTGLLNRSW